MNEWIIGSMYVVFVVLFDLFRCKLLLSSFYCISFVGWLVGGCCVDNNWEDRLFDVMKNDGRKLTIIYQYLCPVVLLFAFF